MSRVVVGYVNGAPQWLDLGPADASTGPRRISGSLVVGFIPSEQLKYKAAKQLAWKLARRAAARS